MKIEELERTLEEEGDAALFSAAEVRPLLRLARAAKEVADTPIDMRNGMKWTGARSKLVKALAAFDFSVAAGD